MLFRAELLDTATWEEKIAERIEATFGLAVSVMILDAGTFEQIAENNPLRDKAPEFLHITLLAAPPGTYDPDRLAAKCRAGEKIVVTNRAVYLFLPHCYADTKLNNNALERALKVRTTTRNWHTVQALLSLCASL